MDAPNRIDKTDPTQRRIYAVLGTGNAYSGRIYENERDAMVAMVRDIAVNPLTLTDDQLLNILLKCTEGKVFGEFAQAQECVDENGGGGFVAVIDASILAEVRDVEREEVNRA